MHSAAFLLMVLKRNERISFSFFLYTANTSFVFSGLNKLNYVITISLKLSPIGPLKVKKKIAGNCLKRSFQNKECSPKRTCAYWLWIVCTPATIKKKNKKNRIYFKICQTKNITNMGDAGYQTWYLCSGSLRLKLCATGHLIPNEQRLFVALKKIY